MTDTQYILQAKSNVKGLIACLPACRQTSRQIDFFLSSLFRRTFIEIFINPPSKLEK